MSIGVALTRARQRAGLSVNQVSKQTRIRETIIRDIENDNYSACGGDFYARGHIRAIAKAAGTDPEPLIREYDTARQAPQERTLADILFGVPATPGEPAPATPGEPDTPDGPAIRIKTRKRRLLNQTVALALALLVTLGFGIYDLISGPRHVTDDASVAGLRAVTHHRSAPAAAPARPVIQPRMLVPVSAAAFGPYRDRRGDHPQLAPAAIDGEQSTAWHTDWYTTARFGNLYRGTGLLLDMGRPVVITQAEITLISPHGAGFQLRAGPAPTLAQLKAVASVTRAGDVVRIRLASPAHGRYLLIWFTRLPRHRSGTFWASVNDVRLQGLPLPAGS